MNITTIELCSTERDLSTMVHLSFPVRGQDRSSPYVLRAATGLDSDEIIKTYNDGPQFFRVRPAQRTVSFAIKLNPNYHTQVSVGDLRDKLYKMISYNTSGYTWNSDSKIEIRFWNGTTYLASLFGFITRVQSTSFAAETEVMVEIQCEYPFLRSTNIINMQIENTIYPPRSYDIFINGWHNIPIHAMTYQVDPKSTAQHGFQMRLRVKNAGQSQLVIFDERNPTKYLFWVVFPFQPKDVIQFSSNEDNKFIFIERNGEFYVSLMDRILWGSVWPFMLPGYNQFDLSEGFHIEAASYSEVYWGL